MQRHKKLFLMCFVLFFLAILPAIAREQGDPIIPNIRVPSLTDAKLKIKSILIGNNNETATVTNYFQGALGFFVWLILGTVGGSLVLFKFATEIFQAVVQSSDDPYFLKKAISRLIITLLVVSLGMGGIFFILGITFG